MDLHEKVVLNPNFKLAGFSRECARLKAGMVGVICAVREDGYEVVFEKVPGYHFFMYSNDVSPLGGPDAAR